MNNRKRLDDRTELFGTPLLIGLGEQGSFINAEID